ncbi:hypothetical protein MMAN_54120 [Mycobacterium mantenii]|uniref:MFS transporter n=1 Tax=Mycobacterium mantenii TaxID=560555 RepID=A0ABM7K0A2_MYCNT|nr:hypothetical protein MMAN_54120 [Mycobacterium mantenii]
MPKSVTRTATAQNSHTPAVERDDARPGDRQRVQDFGLTLFRSLWLLDFLAMALNTAPSV